jgi:hypothetical protein
MPLRNPLQQPDGMQGLLGRLSTNPWINMGAGMSPHHDFTRTLQGGLLNQQRSMGGQQAARIQQLELEKQQREAEAAEAQAQAQQRYRSMLNPYEDIQAGAMGVDDYATKKYEQEQAYLATQQEPVTYWTPKGAKQMPRWVGERANLLPYDVYLQSEEAKAANKRLQFAGNAEQRAQAEHARKQAESRLKMDNAKLARLELMRGQQAKQASEIQARDIAISSVDEALKLVDSGIFSTASGAGKTLTNIVDRLTPGGFSGKPSDAMDGYLTTIQSAIGLDKLIKVKEQGGTFGALSEKELALLTDTLGKVHSDMPDQALKRNLRIIKELLFKANLEAYENPIYIPGQTATAGAAGDGWGELQVTD